MDFWPQFYHFLFAGRDWGPALQDVTVACCNWRVRLPWVTGLLCDWQSLHNQWNMWGVGLCNWLNVCVSPKFVCWNLNPKVVVLRGRTLGRWLVHEGGALKSKISALIRDLREFSDTFCHVGTQWEDHFLEEGALTRHWICQHLDLESSCHNCKK